MILISALTQAQLQDLKSIEDQCEFVFHDPSLLKRRKVFIARDDATLAIVGVACFGEQHPIYEGFINVTYIETVPGHTNKGVGTALAYQIMLEARKIHRGVCFSGWSAEGEKYLRPVVDRISVEFPTVKVMH